MRELMRIVKSIWSHPLNRAGRVNAVLRFFRWQAAARLMPWKIAFPFVDDTYLFARLRMHGATGNWYFGLHEYRDMAFVLHFLRPGDLFVDIGANVGSYSVLAGGAVGTDVLAIEPIPSTFEALLANVTLNGLSSRCRCVNVGLSDSVGVLQFTSDCGTVNHVVVDGYQGVASLSVNVEPLDDLIGNSPVPTLVKLDVEGFELSVIRGASATFSRKDLMAVIMETNGSGSRYGVKDAAVFDAMASFGFFPCTYDPFTRRLNAGRSASGNTIFVRDVCLVEHRLKTSRMYKLVNGTI